MSDNSSSRGDPVSSRENSLVLIHQATGVVMERHRVPAELAMDYLARTAETAGRSVLELAWDIVNDQAPTD